VTVRYEPAPMEVAPLALFRLGPTLPEPAVARPILSHPRERMLATGVGRPYRRARVPARKVKDCRMPLLSSRFLLDVPSENRAFPDSPLTYLKVQRLKSVTVHKACDRDCALLTWSANGDPEGDLGLGRTNGR